MTARAATWYEKNKLSDCIVRLVLKKIWVSEVIERLKGPDVLKVVWKPYYNWLLLDESEVVWKPYNWGKKDSCVLALSLC